MLEVPKITKLDLAFGNTAHMPKYDTLPREYQNMSAPGCRAVSMWFYKGAKGADNGIEIDGRVFTAKEGVNAAQALGAIKSILNSFEPKHEHKIAACGFMLSEWFDSKEAAVA